MEETDLGLVSEARLRKIDKLREKTIGRIVPLPQLVAVGDQSTGKSSLLETTTGIPFPRGHELCTRYATQMTLRRDEKSYIDITIIAGSSASPAAKERLEAYHLRLGSDEELHEKFASIVKEVNALMDIRTLHNPAGSKTFTDDVLKIEKCGPAEDYLTIIDVPGIFRDTAANGTTQDDRIMVESMIRSYMRDPRTIILAVLPCNVDIMTQEILTMAEEYDKDGERTLGILTKPDLLKERTAKSSVCKLIEGKRRPLALGYYVVRGRGGDEDEIDDHSSAVRRREAMFHEEPWCHLPPDRVGVSALRQRLQDLLGHITDKAFPKLREEMRQKLAEVQTMLETLGPPRQTAREQRQYLAAIASKFQYLARAGVTGDYAGHQAFENTDLRLVTAVFNATERFNQLFTRFAHTRTFDFVSGLDFGVVDGVRSVAQGLESQKSEDGKEQTDELPLVEIAELRDIVVPCTGLTEPLPGIMEWIGHIYHQSRGLELGTYGPGLLASAFREQSKKWENITSQYVSKVILIVHRFIKGALEICCPDAEIRGEIMTNVIDELREKYQSGMESARFLVNIERERKPYTLNHYFNDSIQKARGLRMRDTLESKSSEPELLLGKVVQLGSVADAVKNKSNVEHIKQDIHDSLGAFYKVARKRFVDNVFLQAVDHHLLNGPNSPLWLLSEEWVLQLSDDTLRTIAGESPLTLNKRQQLTKSVQDLQDAIKILR
ncbi:hypothetical protein K4F52_010237 [Lecanicillium sp. MT-2017a]|nr:hypothetical protein K4F52_010237 [Lecanicillium sp. MT-2017a]